MTMNRVLSSLAAAGVLAACATPIEQASTQETGRFGEMQQAVEAFDLRRDECKAIHGYDPENPGDLGPHELAPTERAWANCAYDAVRSTLMLESTQPRLYDAIMAEHRTMTDRVESGLMTRDERTARMFELRKDLRQKEIARVSAESQLDQIPQGVIDLIRNSSLQVTRF